MQVSIIIAHRNYERYLYQAIDSAINQTISCSIYVIDDYSDNQGLLIDSINKNYGNRVSVIKLGQNVGPSLARNIAIEYDMKNFKSDYYAILDADDIMMPNKIERCLEVLQSNPNIGVVYADYIIRKENGIEKYEFKKPYSFTNLQNECIVHSGSVIKKEVFQKVGLYDEKLRCAEDWDLWLRASSYFLFYHIPEALTIVNDHSQNSSNSVPKEIWQRDYNRVLNKNVQKSK